MFWSELCSIFAELGININEAFFIRFLFKLTSSGFFIMADSGTSLTSSSSKDVMQQETFEQSVDQDTPDQDTHYALHNVETHASCIQYLYLVLYLARKCVNYNYNTVYDRVSRNEISRFLHEVICAICVCTKLDCEWRKIKRENTLVKLKKRSGCKHKRLDKFDKESDWKISLKRTRARGISNLHYLHLTSNHLQVLPRST